MRNCTQIARSWHRLARALDPWKDPSSFSWLHDVKTQFCGCGEWDNDRTTLLSRVLFPVLYVLAALGAVYLSYRETSQEKDPDTEDSETEDESESSGTTERHKPQPRRWDLDFARIVCIAATVTEHSGGDHFAQQNMLWVQQWVLPYLYATSGFACMFSSSPFWKYELKLLVVLLVGTGANWIADLISGRDWRGNFGDTVFQMAYVAVLMVLGCLLAPLKSLLQWRSSNPTKRGSSYYAAWDIKAFLNMGYNVLLCVVTMVCFVLVILNINLVDIDESSPMATSGIRSVVMESSFYLSSVLGIAVIAYLSLLAGYSGWLVWIILALIYIVRVMIPHDRGGHALYADIYVLGMVAHSVLLRGQQRLVLIIREYWPFCMMFLLAMSLPEVLGRCDLYPHTWIWERFRFNLIESYLIVLLLSGAANNSDTYQVTAWMNMWALYAYVFHVAWARLLPQPWGAIFTYSAIPVFYFVYWRTCGKDKVSKSRDTSQPYEYMGSAPFKRSNSREALTFKSGAA